MSSMLRLLCALAVYVVAFAQTQTVASSPFWPQPAQFSLGSSELMLSSDFVFEQVPSADGDEANPKTSELLQRGLERYHHLYSNYRKDSPSAQDENPKRIVSKCGVSVQTILEHEAEKASLNLDVDESYQLDINQDQGSWKCDITAPTVWGALHALESFTQLLSRYGDKYNFLGLNYGPVHVEDKPRFSHRGLLIDSARHFLPVDTLKMMIDSL